MSVGKILSSVIVLSSGVLLSACLPSADNDTQARTSEFKISFDSNATVTHKGTNSDPLMYAVEERANFLTLRLARNLDPNLNEYLETLTIEVAATSTGTFLDSSNEISQFEYEINGQTFLLDGTSSTSAEVNLTRVDAVNGRVEGTFTANLCDETQMSLNPCPQAGIHTIQGSFNVKRVENI
jgi:hypothetical protein